MASLPQMMVLAHDCGFDHTRSLPQTTVVLHVFELPQMIVLPQAVSLL